ncbi:hypothetical protein SAMN04488573_1501, partial [Bacillus sp. 5mfcol3.1]
KEQCNVSYIVSFYKKTGGYLDVIIS